LAAAAKRASLAENSYEKKFSAKSFFVRDSASGLPDALFSKQKIPIWVNFGGP
jgi:hypothetical protein